MIFKYTYNSTKDTFDLIKTFIYIFNSIIQVSYITYMTYRIINQSGNMILDIILLVISFVYLLIYLITTREFYTKQQLKLRKIIKYIFKGVKYIVNSIIVISALLILLNNENQTDNFTMLMSLIMIFGYIFMLIFDFIMILIDKQLSLIENSLYYDIENFTSNKKFLSFLVEMSGLNISNLPKVENESMIRKIKVVSHRQENKKMRKKYFILKKKIK